MPAMQKTEPKYNYWEFRNAQWKNLRDVTSSNVTTEHVLSHAFRQAADECSHLPRFVLPQSAGMLMDTVGRLQISVAIILALGEKIFGHTVDSHFIPNLAAGGILMFVGQLIRTLPEVFSKEDDMFQRQFGKAEDGFPILPDAQGNKRVYDRACEIVDRYVAASRPRASAAAGFGANILKT